MKIKKLLIQSDKIIIIIIINPNQSLSIASAEMLGYSVVRFSLRIIWCFKTTLTST